MVAKIISGKSLAGALNYNERKVSQGKAELILENGFHKDLKLLSFNDKLSWLKHFTIQNKICKTNTVHISLNFAVGEQLDKDKLSQIAIEYMDKIGFGNQPYLVYLHRDAGHPHVHIVSTNIKSSGERIPLHNIGRTKSEDARKQIEKNYGLIPASKQGIYQTQQKTVLSKVEYGKTDTKRAITNVLNNVINYYKYTSLPEFNAIINQYNITADRGSKESRMFAKKGLVYWVLDENGGKAGVPIKASSIYGNPTLKNLEAKFTSNEALKKTTKGHLQKSIDSVLLTNASKEGFRQALKSKGIEVVFHENSEQRLYGITFVDNRQKVVFKGSDLGKQYSANALQNWFLPSAKYHSAEFTPTNESRNLENSFALKNGTGHSHSNTSRSLLSDLFKSEYQEDQNPNWLEQDKRKKKRKQLSR
ncbi:MAG: hypothetical protein JWN56_986 [Sphingobacteriales bacterium]|nr:hypothetical protein [Sphingobacteriales bacterium]